MSGPLWTGFSTLRLQQAPGSWSHSLGHAPECDRGASCELSGIPLLALTLESNGWGSEVPDHTGRGALEGASFRVWWLLLEA